jgi:hypothetical protein
MNAQELSLTIKAEVPVRKTLKDSLHLKASFTNYLSLIQFTDSLSVKLQYLGFIESKRQKITKINDSSYLATYIFGKKYNNVKVYYSQTDFSKQDITQISSVVTDQYFILPFNTFETSIKQLNILKTAKGNVFAKVKLQDLFPEGNFLTGNLILENSAVRTVDSIIVKGYTNFPTSFLKHYSGLKKGTIFNEKEINDKNNVLNSLSFSNSIKTPEVLFRKSKTTVYLYLKKQMANLFDGVLGFNTNENTNKIELNGYLNLALVNNLNYGEQLLVNYKADGQSQRKFRVKASLPYILGTPFGAELELKIFKRDSTFITTDQQLRVKYQIHPRYSSYIGYKGYESSNLLDQALSGALIEDFTSRFVLLGFEHFSLQNKTLFPRKSEIAINTEIGTRELLNQKDGQLKILTKLNYIVNLNFKNSIFLQNNTKILLSENFVTNELFRFGGIISIRGFNENSIDASLFSVVNTEYRYQFNTGLYIHSIFDIAYFENKSISLTDTLYGYGVGLGLQTKAGLLKISIANGSSKNNSFNLSNTKIHLILSTRF